MTSLRGLLPLVLSLSSLLAPAAFAQATRTWVSGVGDDENPCTRTAPCATLSSALARTASGGEINLIDSASLGPVIIRKSITIDASGSHAGIAVGGLDDGILVDAPANSVVTLRGLHLRGSGNQAGVDFAAGGTLLIEDSTLEGFSSGIAASTTGHTRLLVRNSQIIGNDWGIVMTPWMGGSVRALISSTSFVRNNGALFARSGTLTTLHDVELAQNFETGVSVAVDGTEPVEVNLERATIVGSDIGVLVNGERGTPTVRLSNVLISNNGSAPTALIGGGNVQTWSNNRILGGSTPSCTDARLSLEPLQFTDVPVGTPTQQPLMVLGAIGSPQWSVSGALPDGTLLEQGILSGTPVQSGEFPLNVSLVDGNGCTTSAPYTQRVTCPAIAIASVLPNGMTGTVYGPVTLEATSFRAPLSWRLSSGVLPIGLELSADGVLSGRPTEGGSFPIELSITDGYGCTATESRELSIAFSPDFQSTTTSLSGPVISSFGESVTVVASVAGGSGVPSGQVVFSRGTEELARVELVNREARFSVIGPGVGVHQLSATYLGDTTYGASRAAPFEFTVSPAATTTLLSSVSPSPVDQPVELTASVTSSIGVPVGEITFMEGSTSLGTAALDGSGVARMTVNLAPGEHGLAATFAGSLNYAASSSAVLLHVVATPAAPPAAPAPGPSLAPTGCGCGAEGGAFAGVLPLLALVLASRRRRR